MFFWWLFGTFLVRTRAMLASKRRPRRNIFCTPPTCNKHIKTNCFLMIFGIRGSKLAWTIGEKTVKKWSGEGKTSSHTFLFDFDRFVGHFGGQAGSQNGKSGIKHRSEKQYEKQKKTKKERRKRHQNRPWDQVKGCEEAPRRHQGGTEYHNFESNRPRDAQE